MGNTLDCCKGSITVSKKHGFSCVPTLTGFLSNRTPAAFYKRISRQHGCCTTQVTEQVVQTLFWTAEKDRGEKKPLAKVFQKRGGAYIAGVLHSEPGGHLCEWPR